ncbi:hypothetical protein LguiA_034331 [Lonicera macranthoides]
MKSVAMTVRDFASTANFFCEKETEKRSLIAQLASLEQGELHKQQQQYHNPSPPIVHHSSDLPNYSIFYPPEPPSLPQPNLSEYTLSGKPNNPTINLWDEPPRRRLPPWSTSPPKPKPKPKFVQPKSNYTYQAKHPDQIDWSKAHQNYRAVSPPPTAKQARGIVLKEPQPQPLQHLAHNLPHCLPVIYSLTQIMSSSKAIKASSSSSPSKSFPHPFQFSNFEKALDPMTAIALLLEEIQQEVAKHAIDLRAIDQACNCHIYNNKMDNYTADQDFATARYIFAKVHNSGEFLGGLTAAGSFYLIEREGEREREKKCGLLHNFSTRAEKTTGSPARCTVCHVGEKIYVLSSRLQTPSNGTSCFSLALFSQSKTYIKHSPSWGIKDGVNESLCKMLEVFNSKPSEPAVFIGQELIGGANENEIISLHFNKPLKTPHPDGDNAQIVKWFPRNLAKSIKEPENVAYVTFLQEICSLNKVDYDSVPDSIKFGRDPWLTKNMQDVDCLPLFKCLYTYVQKHHWEECEQSSDTIAFAGLGSDSDENREPDPEEVQKAAYWAAAAQEAEGWEDNFIPERDSPDPDDFLDYDADTDDEDYQNSPWQNWQNPDDNHWNHSPGAPDTPIYGSGNETD